MGFTKTKNGWHAHQSNEHKNHSSVRLHPQPPNSNNPDWPTYLYKSSQSAVYRIMGVIRNGFRRFVPYNGSKETHHPFLQKPFLAVHVLFTKEDALMDPCIDGSSEKSRSGFDILFFNNIR